MGHGQSSHRCHSLSHPSAVDHDDRLSLFVPFGADASAPLSACPADPRVDDLLARHYYSGAAHSRRSHSRPCRQLSKLKKSFSECFRSNFQRLKEEIASECDPPGAADLLETESHRQPSAEKPSTRVMVTDSRVRRLSDSSASGATHSLPRDILEIHLKLKELKQLLSRPDVVTDSLEKRDKWCQTASRPLDEDQERVLHQKDATIAFQKDQLTKLRALLERRVKLTECLSEELSLVKSSSQHARIDSKDARTLDQFLVLLKSIRTDRALKNSDLDKFDEGLNLLTSLSACSRHQAADKTNVAIVNPCSTNRSASNTTSLTSNTAGVAREEPTPLARATPPGQRTTASYFTSPDQAERGRENCNTKMMVYFQGRSPIPYLSVIPLPLSRITLLDVKQSTKSMWSSGAKFRYFFNTIHPDFGPTRQEVLGDEDKVPGIDGKIVVFIQQ